MSFDSFQDLLQMGGHGSYVWSSYAAGIAVLVMNLIRLARGRRRTLNLLRRTVESTLEDK